MNRPNLLELAKILKTPLTVKFYPGLPAEIAWGACFEGAEIKRGGVLDGSIGRGSTPEAAIGDYAGNIAGQSLVFHAANTTRRFQVSVPRDLRGVPHEH